MLRTRADLAPTRVAECRFPGSRSEKVRCGVRPVSSTCWCSASTGASGLTLPSSSGFPSLLSSSPGDAWPMLEGMLWWSAGLPSALAPSCPGSESLPSSDRLRLASVSSKLTEKSTTRLVGLVQRGRRQESRFVPSFPKAEETVSSCRRLVLVPISGRLIELASRAASSKQTTTERGGRINFETTRNMVKYSDGQFK